MTLYQVKLKSDDAQGRREVYGHVSKVVAEAGYFLLLEREQPGMIGLGGTKIEFKDCEGVYAQTRPGSYKSSNQIDAWLQHARSNRLI